MEENNSMHILNIKRLYSVVVENTGSRAVAHRSFYLSKDIGQRLDTFLVVTTGGGRYY